MLRTTLAIILALPLLALSVPAAHAHPKAKLPPSRTCKFATTLRITGELKQGRLQPFSPAIEDVEVPLIWSTKRYCIKKNDNRRMRNWNRCRVKAHDFGMKCMRSVAADPKAWPHAACKSDWSYHVMTGHVVPRSHGYEEYLQNYACVAANRRFDVQQPNRTGTANLRVEIWVKSYGDKGCGGTLTKKSVSRRAYTHTFSCPRQRNASSHVKMPGQRFYKMQAITGSTIKSFRVSYKSLTSPKNTAHGCHTACRRDKRCLAWVFHKAQSQQHSRTYTAGECELIDTYYHFEPSSTTDAGMK
ncbi:MAG: PAN domain-containing protein [Deltaproteobacteria bacterium]|nr:PAN domain-containing protein [Deltaproteobacteria bacterium]